MNQTSRIAELAPQVEAAKADYLALRDKFRERVKHYNAHDDFVEHVIEHAEEFGADSALTALRKHPGDFSIAPDQSSLVADDIAKAIYALLDKGEVLEGLISEREDILSRDDPQHKRIYVMQGREFTFSEVTQTISFLDEPGVTHPLALNEVHPRDDHDLEPDPDYLQERQRSRRR